MLININSIVNSIVIAIVDPFPHPQPPYHPQWWSYRYICIYIYIYILAIQARQRRAIQIRRKRWFKWTPYFFKNWVCLKRFGFFQTEFNVMGVFCILICCFECVYEIHRKILYVKTDVNRWCWFCSKTSIVFKIDTDIHMYILYI